MNERTRKTGVILKTLCGSSTTQSITGRKDAFDQFDGEVVILMTEANPARTTKFSCEDLGAFLRLRSTQRELLWMCHGSNDITTLMEYLDARGIHMRDVIVDIKRRNLRLALKLCKARATSRQLVPA